MKKLLTLITTLCLISHFGLANWELQTNLSDCRTTDSINTSACRHLELISYAKGNPISILTLECSFIYRNGCDEPTGIENCKVLLKSANPREYSDFMSNAATLGFHFEHDQFKDDALTIEFGDPICGHNDKRRMFALLTLIDAYDPFSDSIKHTLTHWLNETDVNKVFFPTKDLLSDIKQFVGLHWSRFDLNFKNRVFWKGLADCAKTHPVSRLEFDNWDDNNCFNLNVWDNPDMRNEFDQFLALLKQANINFEDTVYNYKTKSTNRLCFNKDKATILSIFALLEKTHPITPESKQLMIEFIKEYSDTQNISF